MTDKQWEMLVSIVRQSLFAGITYSLFEGIYLYLSFPLFNLPGVIEASLRNLGLFLGIGIGAYLIFSAFGSFFRSYLSDIRPFILSSLIVSPTYFFLFFYPTGISLIDRYLGSPKFHGLLLVIPALILFFVFSKVVVGKVRGKFTGLATSTFFFTNLDHLNVEWGALVKGKPAGFLSLLFIVAITVAIYYAAIRIRGAFQIAIDRSVQRMGLLKPLLVLFLLGGVLFLRDSHKHSPTGVGHSPESYPNILLIVLDTARSDRFSCYGHWRDTTPFLRSFCEEATFYGEAITPSPWTMPSHASLFTSLYPSAHGLEWNGFSLDERYLTLPEYLSSRGYVTIGFCNNSLVIRKNGLAQGFDYYLEMWKEDIRNPTLYYRLDWFLRRFLGQNDGGALRTNQWVVEWLERTYRGEHPFFLFINLMECHLEYDAPYADHTRFLRDGYSSKALELYRDTYSFFAGLDVMTDEEWQDYQDIYDGDLSYLDERLEELFGVLEANSLSDNTVIVLTGDHGEFLGEHLLTGHTVSLYEPLLKVPLLIKVPDNLPKLPEAGRPVQTVDIFPTLLEIIGDDVESLDYPIQGVSLMRQSEHPYDFTVSEFEPLKGKIASFLDKYPEETDILKFDSSLKAIRVDSLKYIWSSNGDSELYDLSVDPGELNNIMDENMEKAGELEEKLMNWLNSFEHATKGEGGMELDAETLRELRALGYID